MIVAPALRDQALRALDIPPQALRHIGGEDGDVYEVASGDDAFILKLLPTPADRLPALRQRIDLARFLAAHGVPVITPLPTANGTPFVIIGQGAEAVVAVRYPRASGRHPDVCRPEEWHGGLFHQWGRVIGRMHRLVQRYPGGEAIPTWRDEVAFFPTICYDPELHAAWADMGAHLETLPTPRDGFGPIHNDLHCHNVLVERHKGEERLTIIDFDVCAWHWFVSDVGVAVYHALWAGPADPGEELSAFGRRFLARFRQGYEEENLLAQRWWDELPTFLAYRRLVIYSVFHRSWKACNATDGQRRWAMETRRQIVEEEPVADFLA